MALPQPVGERSRSRSRSRNRLVNEQFLEMLLRDLVDEPADLVSNEPALEPADLGSWLPCDTEGLYWRPLSEASRTTAPGTPPLPAPGTPPLPLPSTPTTPGPPPSRTTAVLAILAAPIAPTTPSWASMPVVPGQSWRIFCEGYTIRCFVER